MSPEKIKLLQKAQLQIMSEIHDICVKNNIKYYLIGGSALGAVRHKGFIPWDIDIDIAMQRDDYDRFEEISKTQLPEKYAYHNFRNTKDYVPPHATVCMKGTSLTLKINQAGKTQKTEIYIDIFPLDTPSSDPKLQEKQAARLKKLKLIKERKRGYLFRNSAAEKIVKKAVSLILTPVSYSYIGKLQDKEMRRYHGCGSGLLCSMSSHYSYSKQLMPESVYGEPTLMPFEDTEFFVPQDTHDYLTRIYKDYMKFPPKEDQEFMLEFFQDVSFEN